MSTTLIVVRHGETAWNRDLRFRGLADIPLTENGLKQAILAGQRIASQYHPAAILSSPLQRAMQTAQGIGQVLGLEAVPHDGLLDIDFGDFSGLTFAEAEERFPEEYRDFFRAPARVHFPNGESLGDVSARTMALIPELITSYPDGQVILVTHQVVCKVLLCSLLGLGNEHFWKFRLDNASICEVELARGQATLVYANETCHLKGPG